MFNKKTTVVVNGNEGEKLRGKIIITIIAIIVAIVMLTNRLSIINVNKEFSESVNNFYRLNSKTIFSIDKIYLYSSASAIQNKVTKPIWNINLYQFTDMAIYINNRIDEGLNYENSIKEMYIENVRFGETKAGQSSLYYKDINKFSKSVFSDIDFNNQNVQITNTEGTVQEKTLEDRLNEIRDNRITDKLEFKVLNDGDIDYSKPQIYADCSNPITLEYVNENIKENHILSDISSDLTYNGQILKKSAVILSDIQSSVSFNIIIINNYDQKFIANVYIEIPLQDTVTGESIYDGKMVKVIEKQNIVKFFRVM